MSTEQNFYAPSWQADVDNVVETVEAAMDLMSVTRNRQATSTLALLAGAEKLKDDYLKLGQDYEELNVQFAHASRDRDEACRERDAAVAEVHRLAGMFQKYVDVASKTSESLLSQEGRIQAMTEIFKSINRIGRNARVEAAPPVAAAAEVVSLPSQDRPAASRPHVRTVPQEAPRPFDAVSIEDEISAELDRGKDGRAVVDINDHRRTQPSEEAERQVPKFLMSRREEVPALEESERSALKEAANGFGLGAFMRRKGGN